MGPLSKIRDDEIRRIRWFLIDREMNLRKDLERLYEQISNYNSRIQELLYLGESRTKMDFEKLNKERTLLSSDIRRTYNQLKGLINRQKIKS